MGTMRVYRGPLLLVIFLFGGVGCRCLFVFRQLLVYL